MRTPLDPEAGAGAARDVCLALALAIAAAAIGVCGAWLGERPADDRSMVVIEDDGMLVPSPAAEWRPCGEAR